MKDKVFYLCNRNKCQNCKYPTCKHTANIFYASNFHMENGLFFEDEKSEVAKEKAYLETLFFISETKYEYGEDDDRRIVLEKLENEIKKLLNK